MNARASTKPPSLPTPRPGAARGPTTRKWAALVLSVASAAAASQPGPATAQTAAPSAASVYNRAPPTTAAATTPAPSPVQTEMAGQGGEASQAERIVAGSLAAFGRVTSFSARLRQKVRIGDRVLVGTGRYVQAGQGEDLRFRFESALKAKSETFESLEVCDGLFCWTYQHFGPQSPQLQRVDVMRIRERLQQLRPADVVDPAPHLGGLPRLLASIRESFRFTTATAGDLDGIAVWSVEGRWDPERLAATLPAVAEAARRADGVAAADLPDGFPWSVRLAIGRADLVPRRIEWLAIPGRRPATATTIEPISVVDLSEVQLDGPVDATAFFYQPAPTGLVDVTDQQVKTLALLRP